MLKSHLAVGKELKVMRHFRNYASSKLDMNVSYSRDEKP